MPPKSHPFTHAVRNMWSWLRAVTGDSAYETYLRHCSAGNANSSAAAQAKMTRAEFYSDSLRRKYSTINRCC